MSLASKCSEIYDKVASLLEAEKGNLGVQLIILGSDKFRGALRFPFIRIIQDAVEVQNRTVTGGEQWFMPIVLVGAVKSNDPAQGKRNAQELTLQASSVLIQNRDLDGLVEDIVRIRYQPAEEGISPEGELVYGSAVELQIRFWNTDT